MTRTHERMTLAQFMYEHRQQYHQSQECCDLLLSIAGSCIRISRLIAAGAVTDLLGIADTNGESQVNVQGEVQKKLDVVSNEVFLESNAGSGLLAGMASEEMEHPWSIPEQYPTGQYLLVFDPLDGSSNIDINVSVGSIFSVLKTHNQSRAVQVEDFLQPGSQQIAAGYALYGPSTLFVMTLGQGVHSFALDPESGEFMLINPAMRIPEDTSEFAVNASNSRFWKSAVTCYINECIAGKEGPRKKDFNTRWVGSMVADAHRILTRGGIFMYPRDNKDPTVEGRLRLLYEVNPVSMLVEQAGGRATTGYQSILEVQPRSLHQRIGCIFGSKNEVERLERFYLEASDAEEYESPLFNRKSLFRD